jgi:Tfp pilus assembly protein PilV
LPELLLTVGVLGLAGLEGRDSEIGDFGAVNADFLMITEPVD